MSFFTSHRMRYDTLYGQELTQEELRAAHERRKEKNHLISWDDEEAYRKGEPMAQHHSVGWSCQRNGYWDDMFDYFRASDSWTASKIIRPAYHEDFTVCLRLSIQGKRASNSRRCRPTRWSAVVCMGRRDRVIGIREQVVVCRRSDPNAPWRTHPWGHYPSDTLPVGRCKSLADAMRQADQLDVDEAVERVVRRAYDPHRARCYYRKIEEDGEVRFDPYLMVYGVGHFDQFSLPRGTYVIVEEDTREGEPPVKGHVLERGQWGTCGSYGKPEDRPAIEALGVWWPLKKREDAA